MKFGASVLIIIGLTGSVLLLDFGCLKLRIGLFRKKRTSLSSLAISGILVLRILNIAIFVLVGFWWLNPTFQRFFGWFLLTIPLWNLWEADRIMIRSNQ